ncbi:MAG: hypothetical protein H7Y88_04980, partial [Phycisphaerales bacterium]|nr:hypothetical protein [Phycisphaerales bacterium]
MSTHQPAQHDRGDEQQELSAELPAELGAVASLLDRLAQNDRSAAGAAFERRVLDGVLERVHELAPGH